MTSIKSNNLVKTTINSDGIFSIRLNNAENQNVLSVNMMSRIQSELDESISNNKIRVIIISAEGDIFSAGHDLKELKDGRNNSDKGKTFFKKSSPTY